MWFFFTIIVRTTPTCENEPIFKVYFVNLHNSDRDVIHKNKKTWQSCG